MERRSIGERFGALLAGPLALIVFGALAPGSLLGAEATGAGTAQSIWRLLNTLSTSPRASPAVPTIDFITDPWGKPGDEVIISGSNFLADGSRMTVTFHHEIAVIVEHSETQLKVVVPHEAVSGGVLVCVASDICSEPFPFLVTYEPQVPPWPALSSIAWEGGTRSLWVAVRAPGPTRVFEITPTGALFDRGQLNQPILAHPSPNDGSGRIYFCNSLIGLYNEGTIRYIDSATNNQVEFRKAGTSGTDPVWCRAIAANDLEPDVAYYVDGNNHTVRRIPSFGFKDFNYGNRTFNFGDPAGARFDSAGNLYLTSTTEVFRILPEEAGVDLVASGFVAAAGLDLLEDGGETLLAVADKGSGKIWLVNAGTGLKAEVASGFSNPVGVVFARSSGHGLAGAALYVIEHDRMLRVPDPIVSFERQSDQRILLSRRWVHEFPTEDEYPSADQGFDGRIKVRVQLNPVIDPAGRSVSFYLIDPKDPSRYLDDNPRGRDNLPSPPGGGLSATQVAFDVNGRAETEILVASDYSGNNYQVEARTPTALALARSPIYTTWRRVYIEHNRMWKAGAWVLQDSGTGGAGPASRVFVHDNAIFSVGDAVHILSGDTLETAYGEFGVVDGKGIDPILGPYVDFQVGLSELYRSATNLPPLDQPPWSFLARVDDWMYDIEPDLSRLAIAFDDAFAEWVMIPTGGGLPRWPLLLGGEAEDIDIRSNLFFKAPRMIFRPGPSRNVVELASAERSNALGWTLDERNYSWVFDRRIEDFFPNPGEIGAVREFVSAHELAHQFRVNAADEGGHDLELAWTPSGRRCLMNVSQPFIDYPQGIAKMHRPPSANDPPPPQPPTNDLMCIRTHPDSMDTIYPCSVQ
jgi:hypothetical protein